LNQDQHVSFFTTFSKEKMKNEKNILDKGQGKNENNHEAVEEGSHVGNHVSDKDHVDDLLGEAEASSQVALNVLGTANVEERKGMVHERTEGNQLLYVLFLYICDTLYLDNLC